jgi:hypothetical protein
LREFALQLHDSSLLARSGAGWRHQVQDRLAVIVRRKEEARHWNLEGTGQGNKIICVELAHALPVEGPLRGTEDGGSGSRQ